MKQYFINEMRNDMKNSLWISFHFSNKLNEAHIVESHSRIPNIDAYIKKFIETIDIMTYHGQHDNNFTLTKNVFNDVQGCWFNNVNIEIEFIKNENPKINGVIFTKGQKIVNGKLDSLNGKFIFHGEWDVIKKYIPEIVAHEFLHGYESWKRALNGSKDMFDVANDSGYFKNTIVRAQNYNYVEETLSDVFYYCHNIERRSYASQLNQELLRHKNNISNVDSALKVLENTELYKNYIKLGEKLFQLNTEYKNNEWYQKDIVNYYYKITGKTSTPTNVMKYMIRIYEKTWYYIRKKTMQFIRKIYESNNIPPQWIETFEPGTNLTIL